MFVKLKEVQQSHSVAFADYVREIERSGVEIIKMQTGDPDFATHPLIVDAGYKAILNGHTKYCDSMGMLELRKAIEIKLKKINKINNYGIKNILVTHGAVHGISIAIKALINNGDECILLEPYWRSYQMNVILSGGVPKIIKCKPENNFHLDIEDIKSQISSKTKAIIINTPNNPTGAVYKKEDLIKLAELAAERKIYLISDEVYENIVFENNIHFSPASHLPTSDWVISIFSFSKTYAMTGWRIGYVVANNMIIDELIKLSQFSITSLSPFSQLAAVEALNNPLISNYADKMRSEYALRLEFIKEKIFYSWIDEAIFIPEGAFYALIDVKRFGIRSVELAKKIVKEYSVSFTPGIAFGDEMDGYLRMCFATSKENIAFAINALIDFEVDIKKNK